MPDDPSFVPLSKRAWRQIGEGGMGEVWVARQTEPMKRRVALKVTDFGVAKATGGRLTDETLSTQFGVVVGTLEYIRPAGQPSPRMCNFRRALRIHGSIRVSYRLRPARGTRSVRRFRARQPCSRSRQAAMSHPGCETR